VYAMVMHSCAFTIFVAAWSLRSKKSSNKCLDLGCEK
jgi:hypothetical protein